MLAICAAITLYIRASPLILLPLHPDHLLLSRERACYRDARPELQGTLVYLHLFFDRRHLVPLFPEHLCKRACGKPDLPAHADRAHPAGNRVDSRRLCLFHRALLADRCRPLLHRGTKLQRGTPLLGKEVPAPDARIPRWDHPGPGTRTHRSSCLPHSRSRLSSWRR